MTNRNLSALKDFVDRGYQIEHEFRAAKGERDDLIGDLKTEIKARSDETGVDAKEVMRLIKIRLDEDEQRQKAILLTGDLETFDVIFGPPSKRAAEDEEDI
jgi:uncharacterized protein (UPF0335 family)